MEFYAVVIDEDLRWRDPVRLVSKGPNAESVEKTTAYDPNGKYEPWYRTGYSITPIEGIQLTSTYDREKVSAQVCRFQGNAERE